MTNKDKYLKDNVSVEELAEEIAKAIEDRMLMYSSDKNTRISRDSVAIYEFFIDTAKPTLTEDERVILRNMQHVDTIKRIEGHIYVDNSIETGNYYREEFSRYMVEFDHLFQFIKERRRIRDN